MTTVRMAARYRCPAVRLLPLAILLFGTPAAASLNKTLDISAHASHGTIAESPYGAFSVSTIALRSGATFGPFRYGGGPRASFPQLACACEPGTKASMFGAEIFVGYAPGGYWAVRPFVEVRVHGDRLIVGSEQKLMFGAGPRFGALVPIDEYFFVDGGVSIDLVGYEGVRGMIGIGLPIPMSHL